MEGLKAGRKVQFWPATKPSEDWKLPADAIGMVTRDMSPSRSFGGLLIATSDRSQMGQAVSDLGRCREIGRPAA